MPLLQAVIRVFVQALQGFVGALRWLARQAYRQRALGVASNPELSRPLDLHFVTVAAHVAVVAALLVASPGPSARDWLLSLPLLALLTGVAVWRPTRLVITLLVGLQLGVCLAASLWAWQQPILLTMIVAGAVAQQVALVRNARATLGRATAAGLLLGVFTGGAGLLIGILAPSFPLWVSAVLFVIALVLALGMPAARKPAPSPPKLPRQSSGPPEGYTVYRPSSLDDPS